MGYIIAISTIALCVAIFAGCCVLLFMIGARNLNHQEREITSADTTRSDEWHRLNAIMDRGEYDTAEYRAAFDSWAEKAGLK